ncbi:DNA methyltransferase [Vibrio phage EniLVp02]
MRQKLFKIHCGDCLEWLRSLPAGSVDLVVTDPPYDIKNRVAGNNSPLSSRITRSQAELEDLDIVEGFDPEVLPELMRVMKKPNIYIFCNKAQIPMYLDFFVTKHGCAFDIIKWVKTNTPPTYNNKMLSDTEYCLYFRKGGYCNPRDYQDASTLYQSPINKADKVKYGHPTPKPVPLLRRLIRNSTEKPGLVVLDPFTGSGAVGEAAISEGARFWGAELSPKHYETIQRRLSLVEPPIASDEISQSKKWF